MKMKKVKVQGKLEKLSSLQIPDLWHVAMRLKDSGDKTGSEAVLRVWHIAHALKDANL